MQYRLLLVFALFMLPPVLADSTASPDKILRMGIHNFPPDFVVSADGKSCSGEGYLLAPVSYTHLTLPTTPYV